jgi:hypothetical protein
MAADDYGNWLRQELGGLVDELELDERQKRFMRSRWLDQVVWLEGKAKQAQQRYYGLRLVAIVGGLTVPALVSLNVSTDSNKDLVPAISWTTFALSLLVAVAVAVEGFFRYGERWRHYRRTAELMKGQGWQFYELAGLYDGHRSHRTAFKAFATSIEGLIAADVDAYVSQVTREKGRDAEQDGQAEAKPEA